jgi:hypothetical protein
MQKVFAPPNLISPELLYKRASCAAESLDGARNEQRHMATQASLQPVTGGTLDRVTARRRGSVEGRRQGIFWMLTIPHYGFTPYLPPGVRWIRGQLECGVGGYLHWQLVAAFVSKQSLSGVRSLFGPYNAELTYSETGSTEYVWKDDTAVHGTRFELGVKPIDVRSATDWDSVWASATTGDFQSIPAGIRVRSYNSLRSIRSDHARPKAMDRSCDVFWGTTGTGKSYRAWQEATYEAYSKDPRSKFWCGYAGEANVVIDEFRGGIDISHLLRWLDSYPVTVEIKGLLAFNARTTIRFVGPLVCDKVLDHLKC